MAKNAKPGKGRELPPMQARFVSEYLLDLNATQAAIRAGYSAATAEQHGPRLLGFVGVRAAIDSALSKRAERVEIKAERVLQELSLIGLADMANYVTFSADGELLLDFSNMPEGATRAIAEVTQEEFTDGKGDSARQVRRTKFKLHPKTHALELLGKHLALFVERMRHEGGSPVEIHVIGASDGPAPTR
jgi:phage terminase small subunit